MATEGITIKTFETGKEAAQTAAKHLAQELAEQSGGDNLLLVSGGSSLDVAYWAASSLDMNTTNSVTLAQVDERYGEVGHEHSNWQAMVDKGIQPIMFRNAIEILKLGTTPSDLAVNYNRALGERLDNVGFKVALVGIGEHGEIAGIRPCTSEQFDQFLGHQLVLDYVADDYTRITITARALLQMDLVIVYAAGPDKKQAIDNVYKNLPPNEFPAQMLKQCKRVAVFYGEKE